MSVRKTLKQDLAEGGFIVAPGAYDVLTAKIIESHGFPAVYMTGYGTSASGFGLPDLGFLTMTEMVQNASRMVDAIEIPLIADADTDRLVAVTSAGRMLVISANDLPELTRGKGNKIIGIPSKAVAERSEYVVDIVAVPQGGRLRLNSGKRHLNLRAADLNAYEGERGRRGNKLPRGFQNVDGIECEH